MLTMPRLSASGKQEGAAKLLCSGESPRALLWLLLDLFNINSLATTGIPGVDALRLNSGG